MTRISVVDDYVDTLVQRAQLDVLVDGTVVATIPEAPGVAAFGRDQITCIADLRLRLRDWVHLFHQRGFQLPVVRGIDLNSGENSALIAYDGQHTPLLAGEFFEDEEALERALDVWEAEATSGSKS